MAHSAPRWQRRSYPARESSAAPAPARSSPPAGHVPQTLRAPVPRSRPRAPRLDPPPTSRYPAGRHPGCRSVAACRPVRRGWTFATPLSAAKRVPSAACLRCRVNVTAPRRLQRERERLLSALRCRGCARLSAGRGCDRRVAPSRQPGCAVRRAVKFVATRLRLRRVHGFARYRPRKGCLPAAFAD